MDGTSRIRVAAVQFGVGTDLTANLQTCLQMIDQAGQVKPDVMVLPEFINHLAWYESPEHCYAVSVAPDDKFLQAIAAKAKLYRCYIKVNVTMRRDRSKVTGTNILFNPGGQICAMNDKQVLMGNENNFLTPATDIAPVIETEYGRLGMYACMDGVIPEVARSLAIRRAHLLLNSLNSFAIDEAALHIPVRAAENKVFVAAANKVGSLVPEELRETVAARLKIPPEFLEGSGESQIVAPDGRTLAKAPMRGEAVIFADIDLREAENKLRPDGTDIFLTRRPELYTPLGLPPQESHYKSGAPDVLAGVIQVSGRGQEALAFAAKKVAEGVAAGAKLIVLPELFHITTFNYAEEVSYEMIRALQTVAKNCYVATSIVEDGTHTGILFNHNGVVLKQPQLHSCGRYSWSELGNTLNVFDCEWGRIALIVGNDSIYPETFRLAALQGVEVVAVPTQVLEEWEMTLGFKERAAENRMNILVASSIASGIYAITRDFTLWTEWRNRPFDGNINSPVVTMTQSDGLKLATIHPAAAANKMISYRTHLLNSRPWRLAQPIIS